MHDLNRQFAYDAWANDQAMAVIAQAAAAPARALEIMAHVAAAQELWLERVKRSEKKVTVWPSLTVEQCQTHLRQVQSQWPAFFDTVGEDGLRRTIEYTNSLGEHWTNTVGDILQHVLFHGVYHRGQIATHLRGAGIEPAYTDFIHAVRQGLLVD